MSFLALVNQQLDTQTSRNILSAILYAVIGMLALVLVVLIVHYLMTTRAEKRNAQRYVYERKEPPKKVQIEEVIVKKQPPVKAVKEPKLRHGKKNKQNKANRQNTQGIK